MGGQFWHLEGVLRSEFVVFVIEHFVVEIIVKEGHNEPPVFIVSDPTTIVALCDEILKCGEGYFVVFVQEHLYLAD